MMNNETVKKFDVTIKLRGDNVYDLYIDGKWISSRGNSDSVLDDAKDTIKKALINE